MQLSGVAILGVGIWLRVDESVLELIDFVEIDESDPLLKYAALVLIAVGSLVFVVGFVGCLGALKANRFLLGLVSTSTLCRCFTSCTDQLSLNSYMVAFYLLSVFLLPVSGIGW